jgi:hypothetical protein
MGKSRAPEVDEDGLADYLTKYDVKLLALQTRFAEYEALVKNGELPASFVAIDVLVALLGARMEGYSDSDLRACWPEAWGNGELTIPAALLREIGQAWLVYKDDTPGKTFGEVFGLEGGGQGRQKAVTAQRKRDQHRFFGQLVALKYDGSPNDRTRPTLDQVIEAVASEHGISVETVENAYKKFGRPLTEEARRRGILKGGKTS